MVHVVPWALGMIAALLWGRDGVLVMSMCNFAQHDCASWWGGEVLHLPPVGEGSHTHEPLPCLVWERYVSFMVDPLVEGCG